MATPRTMEHAMTGAHTRWAVLWHHEGKWHVKDFENDFPAALALYVKAKPTTRRMVTLLCRNVGFPPPEHLRHRVHHYAKVFDSRAGKKIKKPVYEWRLKDLNDKGVLWCPYCRELRRFKARPGYLVDNSIYMPTPNLSCPVCGITTENYHVRKQNPAYSTLFVKDDTPTTNSSYTSTPNAQGGTTTDDAKARKRERARLRRERAKQGT